MEWRNCVIGSWNRVDMCIFQIEGGWMECSEERGCRKGWPQLGLLCHAAKWPVPQIGRYMFLEPGILPPQYYIFIKEFFMFLQEHAISLHQWTMCPRDSRIFPRDCSRGFAISPQWSNMFPRDLEHFLRNWLWCHDYMYYVAVGVSTISVVYHIPAGWRNVPALLW